MNERIRELDKEAEDYADDIFDQGGDFRLAHTRKFAELIVRECLSLGDDLSKHYMNTHSARDQAMLLASIADYTNAIKQHFGVEE